MSITCFYSMFLFGLKYILLKMKIFQKITSNNKKLENSIYHKTWLSQIIIQIELCYSSAQCLSKSYPALSPSINPDFSGCFYRDGVKAALVSGAMSLHSVVAWKTGRSSRYQCTMHQIKGSEGIKLQCKNISSWGISIGIYIVKKIYNHKLLSHMIWRWILALI